jgi:hypothetical protein
LIGVRVPLVRREGVFSGEGVGTVVEAIVEALSVLDPGVESLRIMGFVPALRSDVTSILFNSRPSVGVGVCFDERPDPS